jgi:hypothetical protein
MSTIKRTAVLLVAAVMVAAGSTSPAFASKEERIRTETIEIYFPKTFKAPKSGCSNVPIRYEWRYFLNHLSVGARITLETKKEWAVGEVYLQPDFSGGGGVVNLKICAKRWVGEEESIGGEVFPGDIYQGVKKGKYLVDLWVTDFDNKENSFQFPKRKPLRLT